MQLLDRLLIRWLHPIEAIYHREAERALGNYTLSCWHSFIVFFVFSMFACFTGTANLLAVVVLMLPAQVSFFRLQTTFTASGTITDEVEARTLESLRALPHPLYKIITSKYAGVLARARSLLYRYLALRAAFVFLIFGLLLGSPNTGLARYLTPTANLAALTMCSLYMLIEPLLDYATDAALGLGVSAISRSRNETTLLSIVGSLGLQAAQVFVGFALVAAQHTTVIHPVTRIWQLAMWGGGWALLPASTPAAAALLIVLAVLLRYVLVRGLLAAAVWRVQAI